MEDELVGLAGLAEKLECLRRQRHAMLFVFLHSSVADYPNLVFETDFAPAHLQRLVSAGYRQNCKGKSAGRDGPQCQQIDHEGGHVIGKHCRMVLDLHRFRSGQMFEDFCRCRVVASKEASRLRIGEDDLNDAAHLLTGRWAIVPDREMVLHINRTDLGDGPRRERAALQEPTPIGFGLQIALPAFNLARHPRGLRAFDGQPVALQIFGDDFAEKLLAGRRSLGVGLPVGSASACRFPAFAAFGRPSFPGVPGRL